jgi:hypothetical protein
MTWLTVTKYLCQKWLWICSTCRKHFPVLSSFMTRFVTGATRWVLLVEKELLTFPENLSLPPLFSRVCVAWYIVLCVAFSRSLFVLLSFLAHQRVMWGIAITWRPSSVVRPLTFHILIYSSETTGPNGTKLGRKHLYKILYKVSSFRPILPTNMAAKGNSCFWLANVKKKFSSETVWPNGAKLVKKHLCKILYKTFGNNSKTVNNIRNLTG